MDTPGAGRPRRLLFCSYHGYLDPSSGAALATRDLLEALAGRGWACGVLCGPDLDFERPESPEQLLSDHRLPFEARRASAGGLPVTVYHFVQAGVPVTIYHQTVFRASDVNNDT